LQEALLYFPISLPGIATLNEMRFADQAASVIRKSRKEKMRS
jgi:hypothetical protein